MKAIIPAVRNLGYTDFMKDTGYDFITLKGMKEVAAKASHHPAGYFEMIVKDRSERLEHLVARMHGAIRLTWDAGSGRDCAQKDALERSYY